MRSYQAELLLFIGIFLSSLPIKLDAFGINGVPPSTIIGITQQQQLQGRTQTQQSRNSSTSIRLSWSEFYSEPTTTKTSGLVDDNGKEFVVGGIARVAVAKIKAYQVSQLGRGRYDESSKAFVADEKLKYLILPVGLRGTITKTYDVDEISANFPIQVKFVPEEHTDEGYSAPVPFVMHFRPDEVECV
ncbi:hypothetical protein ACA910_005998 [Epithemia clementina (nom. ined.)]